MQGENGSIGPVRLRSIATMISRLVLPPARVLSLQIFSSSATMMMGMLLGMHYCPTFWAQGSHSRHAPVIDGELCPEKIGLHHSACIAAVPLQVLHANKLSLMQQTG